MVGQVGQAALGSSSLKTKQQHGVCASVYVYMCMYMYMYMYMDMFTTHLAAGLAAILFRGIMFGSVLGQLLRIHKAAATARVHAHKAASRSMYVHMLAQ